MILYRNICDCGKYRTNYDLPFGVAKRAAEMHVMLDGWHEVKIQKKPEQTVEVVTR